MREEYDFSRSRKNPYDKGKIEDGGISRDKAHKRLTFEERVKGREDKCASHEWDTGAPRGDEIF